MLSLIVVTLLTLKLYAIHYSKANPWLSLYWDITQFNQMVVFIPIFLVFVAILKDFRSCNRVASKHVGHLLFHRINAHFYYFGEKNCVKFIFSFLELERNIQCS